MGVTTMSRRSLRSSSRLWPRLVASALFALPAVAHAKLDVQFSAGVSAASAQGAEAAARVEQEFEAAINAAIERLADSSGTQEDREALRRLRDVNQIVRVMCREEAATDPALADLVAQSDLGAQAGGAATRGAFDQGGNPIEGGTIIMVIECARLKIHGWYGQFGVGNNESMVRVFGHELLHACGGRFRHGDDNEADEALYDPFAERFRRHYAIVLEDVRRQLRDEARRRRRAERKRKRAGKGKPTPPPECPPEGN